MPPDTTRERIESLLAQHSIVLFMKGVPGAPQCGFSARASGILESLGVDFHGVNVLADQDIREGIKAFGNWPTIPQLYVRGELVGGSDILQNLYDSGDLFELLGVAAPDRTPPAIHISDAAARAISAALEDAGPGQYLHLSIDPHFNAQFQLGPVRGGEIVAESAGIRVHFDAASAQRAKGLEIDWIDDARGAGLAIRNPNAPTPVKSISVRELHDRIAAGIIDVIDVRPASARAIAPFPGPHEVLDEDSRARLEALPKELPIAFICHHGNSSRQAAEHFRSLGFHDLYNVEGGIDAWSMDIDPSVPRY
ncbi:MAG: Grx4 family monothiol glutaredoxin [Lysobacteraceae bacterium]